MQPTPSLLLVHGAASGAWVWDAWRRHLRELGWQVNVLDLRGHGRSLPTDLSSVTMEDYVADVASVTTQIEAAQGIHPVLGGWSMGGMIAMMYASQHAETSALLLFDPMLPLEAGGKADIETVRRFSGARLTPATFGIDASDPQRTREVLFDLAEDEVQSYLANCAAEEESGIAFRQTLRGISIPAGAIRCPSLIVYGAEAGSVEAKHRLAEHLDGGAMSIAGAGHWGVVYGEAFVRQAAPAIDLWLNRVL
jgi:pimeloyl-ACP methyl ester carboxylesterase